MKYILTFFLLIGVAYGQTWIPMSSNYKYRGVKADSILGIPKFADTSLAAKANGYLIIVDTTFYFYSGKWNTVKGVSIDTTSLSNRINAKADSSIALQKVTDNGNSTTNDIQLLFDAETIYGEGGGLVFNNGSRIKEGTIDASNGGYKGVALICSIGYEMKWEGGRLFIMNQGGTTIREAKYNFDAIPTIYDDISKGFIVGSRWILDNGNVYLCLDNTDDAAIWNLQALDYVDSIFRIPGIDSIYYNQNNITYSLKDSVGTYIDTTSLSNRINLKLNISDTVNKWVNTIYRKSGKDSIYYKIGSTEYSIKDSAGGVQNGRFGNDTATIVMAKVHNDAGSTLTNGEVVYLSRSGTSSDAPSVKRGINKSDSTSANTFGFVSGTIANNDTGWIILSGKIEKLNTSAFSNGDIIYLDSIAGKYTKSKPKAPYHLVYLGAVVKSNAGNGSIEVRVQNGYEIEELHDVQINSALNNQIIVYSDTQKLWKNRNVYSIVDTTKLSSRIDARVKYTDTASMLSPYLRKVDTASLSNRINLKLNISDTSAMLSKYARKNSINLQSVTDSGNTTTNDIYIKKLYFYDEGNDNYSSLIVSDNYITFKDANNTQVSTFSKANDNFTFNGSNGNAQLNTINLTTGRNFSFPDTLGTFAMRGDSTIFSTKYRTDTARTNIYSAINGRLKISDTATMLNPYAKTNLVNTKLNISDTSNKWVNTITRTPGKDSIIFYIGSTRYAIKDSTGGGGSSYTFSTGLTNTSGTITNNLSTGISGGQSVVGGTAASENLTLSSTSNATKGKLLFGTSAYFENTNNLGVGTSTDAGYKLDVNGTGRVSTSLQTPTLIGNTTSGGTLTLQSTSNATKGKILFGTSAYDEVNNRLGIGTSSPSATFQNVGNIIIGDSATLPANIGTILGGQLLTHNNASNNFIIQVSNSVAGNGPSFQFKRARGTTSVPSQVQSGDAIGGFFCGGYTNNNTYSGNTVAFKTIASENYTSTATGSHITFETTPIGSTTRAEAIRILSSGNLAIGTTSDAGYKLDVNGTTRLNGTTLINTSSNPNNFTLRVGGSAGFSSGISAENNTIITAGQIATGSSSIGSSSYRTTNTGSDIIPKLMIRPNGLSTSGLIFTSIDGTNQLCFNAFNSGSIPVSRASIGIVSLTNTAGSESGDLAFLTQSGGTAMSEKMRITGAGGLTLTSTNTAAGTTGNQTINKPSGTVNIAAAGTTVTVTNSLVTTSSIVFAVIRTNDATATIKNVVPGAGTFTINLNAATTAETSIGFFVIN